MTKEQAKEIIGKLVERFQEHYEEYHAADYNEAKVRQDFINPFFKALGWDIDNERGDSESYREVIYEDKVFVRGKAKAPDYGFRLQGSGKSRLFYVEAKKPSTKPALKLNRESAYQLRRYGSSAQAGVSILTNFEDFIVYDCSRVPNVDDSASVARLKHIHFKEYLTDFDFIYDTFSHEAVTKGRFDKFIQSDANKKGKDTLDKRFVQSLDEWRQYLAKSMATSNKKLDDEQLNFAVQLTIDRLIFLRFCEDRAVEPYGQLQKAVTKGDSYKNLFALFKLADDKYNSGLFDFEKDTLTPSLKVDNKVMKNIIDELYYPQCNFEFSVMPVEILGNAYEQFLGKVIRITPARSVKIEEKPEVRKAGGVYYTPQYIVEYIVKNTVGKLIEGKTPKEISAIKIVDPACGSGSFLLGAFDFLLSHHIDWYHKNGFAAKKGKDNPFTPQGTLTTHEKKRILINNIFGVDIDANAVEVTKLSLLLKCMEGETEASIHQQMAMFHERVLPDLDNNIKDGNSLIDADFYDSQIDLGYERKIKPFSWRKGFPQVFMPQREDATRDFKKQFDLVKKQTEIAEEKAKRIFDNYSKAEEPVESYGIVGGFDAVIGNPPYGALFSENELNYFKIKYRTSVWRGESYLLFVEQGLRLLRNEGLLGYIIPDTILNLGFTKSLREYLLQNSELKELINLPSTVFSGATVDTIILLTEKKGWTPLFHPSLIEISVFPKRAIITSIKNPDRTFQVNASEWSVQGFFNLQSDSADHRLLQKIEGNKKRVSDIASLYSGIKTYELGKGFPPQTIKIRDSKPYTSENKVSKEWSTFFDGKHIGRYVSHWQKDNWIKYGSWLAAPRDAENFEGEKILIRKITGKRLIATYVPNTSYCNTLLFVLKLKSKYISYQSLLAVLNSSLIGWYFRKKFQINEDDTFPQIMIRDIEQFPIPEIHESAQAKLDKYVNLLLELNLAIQSEKLPANSEQIKTRIAHSEEKIDQLVYELYQLTPEEIKIVEGGSDE